MDVMTINKFDGLSIDKLSEIVGGNVFLKQECVTKSAFICLVLLGLIGAIVILCDGYKGSYLGLSAILASYSIMVWWILSLLT